MNAIKKNVLYPGRIEKNNLGDILINGLLIREILNYSNVYIKGKISEDFYSLIALNNPNIGNLSIINIRTDNLVLYKIRMALYLINNRKFDFVFDTPGHITETGNQLKTTLKAIMGIITLTIYGVLGIKSIKYGITLGPFSRFNWKLYRIISNKSKLIVVRDSENYNLLIKKQFSHIKLKPDLSFLLYDLLKNNIHDSAVNTNIITLSFRGSISGKELNQEYFNNISDNVKNLILLLKSKYVISQIDLTYQVDSDRIVAEMLKKRFENEIKDVEYTLINKQLDLQSALEQYSKSRFVITNRLHVFLLAMMLNTKTFIVTDNEKHTKLISILKDLELQELIFGQDTCKDKFFVNGVENFRFLSEIKCSELSSDLNSLLATD